MNVATVTINYPAWSAVMAGWMHDAFDSWVDMLTWEYWMIIWALIDTHNWPMSSYAHVRVLNDSLTETMLPSTCMHIWVKERCISEVRWLLWHAIISRQKCASCHVSNTWKNERCNCHNQQSRMKAHVSISEWKNVVKHLYACLSERTLHLWSTLTALTCDYLQTKMRKLTCIK